MILSSKKVSVLALLSAAGASHLAKAEDVKVVKKSAVSQIGDGLYGDVEARLQSIEVADTEGETQKYRLLVLRPKIGTKLMNEKLNVNYTQPITNAQNSAKTSRPRAEVETNLSVLDKQYFAVDIYSFHYLKNNESPYQGIADLDVKVKNEYQAAGLGKIEASLLLEPEANLTTSEEVADISKRERSDGLAVADSEAGNETYNQKETTKAFNMYPLVAVYPSAVPGLKLAVGSWLLNTYKPKYKVIEKDDGGTKLESDGYSAERGTQVRYTVKYEINEGLYVYNQLRQNFDGYFGAAQKAGTRFTHLDNRTGIVMSLF